MKQRKRFRKMMKLLTEKVLTSEADIFFGYQAHVENFNISVHLKKWSDNKSSDFEEYIYFDHLFSLKKYNHIMNFLKEL